MAQENNIIQKPNAIDKEVIWDKTQTIMSKTDLFGTIEYINDVFTDVSGYEDTEIVSKPHNTIRHPDMPFYLNFTISNTKVKLTLNQKNGIKSVI